MRQILLYIFAVLMLFIQSCIKEPSYDCKEELLLRFTYSLNNQYTNLFETEVTKVTVFIFDNNGKYVNTYIEEGNKLNNNYVMRIPLPKGTYSALVYGGNLTTYSIGVLNNRTNRLNTNLQNGVADINNLHIELNSSNGAEGYIYPDNTPNDLYVGLTTNAISTYDNQTITDVELIKNTKDINVRVLGINSINSPLDIHILATNGRYDYQNDIETSHGTLKHYPISTYQESDTLEANLKIMRLVLDKPVITENSPTEQQPRLVIKNNTTGESLYDEDIINQILQTHGYNTQEDFDREDEFNFEIKVVNDIKISVFINGWEVIEIKPYQ